MHIKVEIEYLVIWKNLNGIATEKEIGELERWLKFNSENRKYYKYLKKHYDTEGIEISEKEMEKAWNSLRYTMLGIRKSRRFEWLKYAAAILVPLVLFFAVWKISNYKPSQTVVVENEIKPGQSKALLTLHDGTVIEINKSDTVISVGGLDTEIHIDSSGVDYSTNNEADTREVRYNTLQTQRGEEFQVMLADGTMAWLNAETTIRYPERFTGNERQIYLIEGEAFLKVAANKKKPFYLNFDQQQIKVLGTEFNVRSYRNEKTAAVTLSEGSIALQSDGRSWGLVPNRQLVINKNNQNIQLRKVDASLYAAWTNGKFVYKDKSLELILKDLERWYDISVSYQNKELKKKRFSLYINRYSMVQDVLNVLEATKKVRFSLQNKQLLVKANS